MLLRRFESHLGLGSSGCGIFWSSSPGVFSGHSGFLPSFIGLMIQPTKSAQINAISTLSNLIAELSLRTKWHATWHLHVISVQCVAGDLHMIVPRPLERACWRQFRVLWGDCKKSQIAPLNAIIIIIMKPYHYQSVKHWCSAGCPARSLPLQTQCYNCVALCHFTVIGWDSKFGSQLLSQCGRCVHRFIPRHCVCCWDIK